MENHKYATGGVFLLSIHHLEAGIKSGWNSVCSFFLTIGMSALKVSDCTPGHAEVGVTWIWLLLPDNYRLAHHSRARAQEAAMIRDFPPLVFQSPCQQGRGPC